MPKSKRSYPPEFRRQMVGLVQAGRSPEALAREFEPTAQSIRNWVAQAARDAGRDDGGLTTAEREELSRLRRENRQLRLEREILSKAAAWFARETNAIPPKGSASGYYAWRKRRPSPRTKTDTALTAKIRLAHAASRGTYGAPRVHAELVAKGVRIGRKRVARLMSRAGLAGVSRRRFVTTTVRDHSRQAPDLVERNFTAEAPDRLWVSDITYVPTWAGFLYLAVVVDAFSRRIVGWSMATTLATQLVLDALNMALLVRRPGEVIHHSDQGSQGGFN